MSRAVLGSTFLLAPRSCAQLSLGCRRFWACPAQSCFSSIYNALGLIFMFVASQSYPKSSLPALLSFATGSAHRQCGPMLPAQHICNLLFLFKTGQKIIPPPKPLQESLSWSLQTLWKLHYPTLNLLCSWKISGLCSSHTAAARCCLARVAVSEREPLVEPGASEQNFKKIQTTHKPKIIPSSYSQSPLLLAHSLGCIISAWVHGLTVFFLPQIISVSVSIT